MAGIRLYFLLLIVSIFVLTGRANGQWVEPDSIMSIAQLRQDFESYGESDSLGREVTITGIANTESGLLHEVYLQTYIQSDTSGVSIFSYTIDEPVSMGDSLVVKGTEQWYFGQPELLVTDYKVYPRKETAPEPANLFTAYATPQKYQGMLVKGSGIIKEKGNRFNGKYLMLAPSDSTGPGVMIYVSNFHALYQDFNFDTPAIGDRISVTGVMGQFDPADPEGTTYKVFLRTPDDLSYAAWPRYYYNVAGLVFLLLIIVAIIWMIALRIQVKRKTTELKKSLDEKKILLQEIHHRVKNNLAAISGILELQSDASDNREVHRALQESQARIKSMVIVHEKLYQSVSLKNISMKIYLEELTQSIRATFADDSIEIDIQVKADSTRLPTDLVIPIGLLVNELLVNAFKYAFKGRKSGKIWIELMQVKEIITLRVEDNGTGLPEGFAPNKGDSLGMVLINVFADQLRAQTVIDNTPGACFVFRFPLVRE